MRCPACDAELAASPRFCGACGYRLQHAPAIRSRRHPLHGATIAGRYVVAAGLGVGSFAEELAVTDAGTGRPLALALVHPWLSVRPDVVAWCERTHAALRAPPAPHLREVLDLGVHEDRRYVVTHPAGAPRLDEVLRADGPLPWRRALAVLGQLAGAVAVARARGLDHYLLAPTQIYLGARPPTASGDAPYRAAVALAEDAALVDLTAMTPSLELPTEARHVGLPLAALDYMSLEELLAQPTDARSDVYALGVIAYEMLTGQLPHPDVRGPAAAVLTRQQRTVEPPSQRAARDLPPAAEAIILRCLARAPADRFAALDALSAAARAVLAEA